MRRIVHLAACWGFIAGIAVAVLALAALLVWWPDARTTEATARFTTIGWCAWLAITGCVASFTDPSWS